MLLNSCVLNDMKKCEFATVLLVSLECKRDIFTIIITILEKVYIWN